ncbi:folic acid binding / transferase [Rhynchospora pubera]|uniref:glutamate formimidoyltransferase n=1 Tax=Rhynchospora pubera TaxID=906938 RepID=A0AAV8DQ69_9POAL|nr:folic acid binding / transferase [Rhynchospora pubera]
MLKNMLACCKLYVSESRNTHALCMVESSLQQHPKTLLVNRFTDEVYNRVGYTLVSVLNPNTSNAGTASSLKEAVFDMIKTAYEFIDLGMHCGTHPRLGVVDHVCFHPLRCTSLDQAAAFTRSVAAQVGEELAVPTYLYGAAHTSGRTLASIRRELGYFKPNCDQNQWAGSLSFNVPNLKPDFGPTNSAQNSKGVLTIGATKWVDNYNVPIHCTNIELVKRIARRVSERGGGLESVQAMGLAHTDGVMEVACNLLNPGQVGADRVQAEVERLGKEEGLNVGKGYFTDFSEERIVDLYMQSVNSM